ncbi:hypothetical protein PG2010B_1367 [Bifidobacterium animalis subsp. lactis]|nr:hypothetical protein PG2007B_1424 [Bifidobacterium animalis subsp. lactis]RYM91613.1 hypothetical protein PG2010B_1367 [Bifidobacterium animalis subsp. lactis]
MPGTKGSSPRLRGTPVCPPVRSAATGIIPALAGNTRSKVVSSRVARDHPRACGEHYRRLKTQPTAAGSSPRLRGTPTVGFTVDGAPGIIPALAGNTKPPTCIRPARWDHPRACGEHHRAPPSSRMMLGSSPRLRGTPHPACPRHCRSGIIPALAGNTSNGLLPLACHRDHPRACGEHLFCQPM